LCYRRWSEELAPKNFTNGKDDRPAVAQLYAKGFAARFGMMEKLDYIGLGWGDGEAEAVAAVLAAGAAPKLRELHLVDNSIGAEGARALAGALPGATFLKKLDFRSNSIGSDGARALAEALPGPMALEGLYLGGNSIGNRRRGGAGVGRGAAERDEAGGDRPLEQFDRRRGGARACECAVERDGALDLDLDNFPLEQFNRQRGRGGNASRV
jgi:hypothetical protein